MRRVAPDVSRYSRAFGRSYRCDIRSPSPFVFWVVENVHIVIFRLPRHLEAAQGFVGSFLIVTSGRAPVKGSCHCILRVVDVEIEHVCAVLGELGHVRGLASRRLQSTYRWPFLGWLLTNCRVSICVDGTSSPTCNVVVPSRIKYI